MSEINACKYFILINPLFAYGGKLVGIRESENQNFLHQTIEISNDTPSYLFHKFECLRKALVRCILRNERFLVQAVRAFFLIFDWCQVLGIMIMKL